MRRIWDVVIWVLAAASIVLAVVIGASSLWSGNGSEVLLVAITPGLVAVAIYGIRDGLRSERQRRDKWPMPYPYKRDWIMFFAETLLAPIFLGLFASAVVVSVVALLTHAIVH